MSSERELRRGHVRATRSAERTLRRRAGFGVLVLALALLIGPALLVSAPAQALPAHALPTQVLPAQLVPSPSPTPSRPGTATTIVTSPTDFSPTGVVTIRGTKLEGSSVVVTATRTGTVLCRVAADASTGWSCGSVSLPNGADFALTATETPPSTVPAPSTGSTTIDVLGPPVMDGDGSYLTTGLVSGIGYPGSVVTISINGSVDSRCASVPVAPTTLWSCNISSPTGGPYVIRSQQANSAIADGSISAFSNVQTVTVDRDPPASAVITSPADGATISDPGAEVTVEGTGEEGAVVDVYVDNVPVCATTTTGGIWRCPIGTLGAGTHGIRAIQKDAAGNFAAPSQSVTVTVASPPPAGTPSPTPSATAAPSAAPTASPSPRPSTPNPSAPAESPAPSATDGPPATEPTPAPSGSESAAPVPGGGQGPNGPAPGPLTNWGTPTDFGSSLSTPSTVSGTAWYIAPLLGLLFLALIAIPLRLLLSAVRGRTRFRFADLWGRNRTSRTVSPDDGQPINPWIAGIAPLAVAAVFVLIAGGVGGEVRYLRLFGATGAGLALLNVVGVAIATMLGARAAGTSRRLRFLPLMLVAAAATALLSRVTGLEPPLIAGVLIGPAFLIGTPVKPRALVNLAQVASVTLLGLLAWSVRGLLPDVTVDPGFWPTFTTEMLAAVCLAGLGSALILVLPVAGLPGRVILEWSLPVWTATVVVVASIVALVILSGSSVGFPLVPWMLVATGFAAICLATWAFVRYVEPQVRA